ncbi:MAG: transglycosylase domain-containing protein [Clostridiales bacterium]|nr:transglycosylase domain-containing protein [Clostridiales bacterium]
MAKKRKKKIKSHVKRLKLQQKKNPMSQKKYKQKLRIARRKDFFRCLWKVLLAVCIALVAVFLVGNLMLHAKTGETLFSIAQEAKELVENSTEDDFKYAETTYVYSADGTKIAELAEDTDATFLEYDEIPADVVNAFVAVEDRTFWTNSGIDMKGIVRVCLNYVRTRGEVAEGASTITQQLARGTFLSNEKTMLRKIKEIFIARELTKHYSKEEIMTFYCNTCCFANGIYGVEDAANTYFGKSVDELTLSETAYLCAIPNRPEYYNPLKSPENALTRRDKILEDMEECGYITSAECEEAQAQSIVVEEPEEDDTFYNYETTYAINCAVRYLMKLDGFEFQYEFDTDEEYETYNDEYDEYYAQAKHKLYTGGYEVYTTIDLEAQSELQEILDEELAFSEDLTDDGIYELQGAMTVIDNESGKVVAIIGGRSQEDISNVYSLNRAYQGYAQPGSSFKPLAVYTPALNDGYTASSMLTNIDVTTAKTSTSSEIASMSGSRMTLRSAVENSENGCAYWLFNEITPTVGLSYVTEMCFSRIVPDDYTLSASLGGLTYGVSTVEMANAYATLENHGEYTQTDCISSILNSNGDEIYEEPDSKIIYDSSAADAMTDVLEGVLTSGTAKGVKWSSASDIAAAGKTGTTNDYKAGWFCGYTPYYTIAVWVGCDTPKTVSGLLGSTYPLYIWKAAMLYMTDGLPQADFDLEISSASSGSSSYTDTDTEEEELSAEEETEAEDADTSAEDTEDSTEEDEDSTINGTTGDTSTTINGADIPTSDSSSSSSGSSGSSSSSGSSGSSGFSGSSGSSSSSDSSGTTDSSGMTDSSGSADSSGSSGATGSDTSTGSDTDDSTDAGVSAQSESTGTN